ncbi:MAG: ATP-binding cassette domain-containing protein [Spirochaetaceae bacterium]
MLIQGQKISYRYKTNSEYTLEDISFRLDNKSKVGLIGDNGTGKSTLLKILIGQLKPEGLLTNSMEIAYLSQEVETESNKVIDLLYLKKEKLLNLRIAIEAFQDDDCTIFSDYQEAGGWDYEVQIDKWLTRFNFTKKDLYRDLIELSGGEKTKINLISLLLQDPDILLLDEPTNHLDLESTLWLESFLKSHKTPYIIISHDREFLDNITTTTWEIEDNRLEEYSGNYSFYKKMKEEKYNLEMHLYQEQCKKVNKLKKSLKDRKDWGLSHQAQTGPNGYAPIYEELKNKAKNTMRNAMVLENRIHLLIEKEEKKKPTIKESARIVFEQNLGKAGKNCITMENLGKSFTKNLFSDLNLVVKHGERVAVTGLNGSGKTTLLKMIMGLDINYSGRIFIPKNVLISYFSQEYEDLNHKNSILDEITDGELSNQGNVRRSLASIGFKADDVFRIIEELSPGEKSKVALVKAMLSNTNLLILDEPTNHLEIRTREVVEEALLNYKGTIIFVSHDRRFTKKVATSTFNL